MLGHCILKYSSNEVLATAVMVPRQEMYSSFYGDLTLLSSGYWFTNWPPYMEGKEGPMKEVDHSRWVDGMFNKQGNLHMRIVLGATR